MKLNNTTQYAIRILNYIASTKESCNAKHLSEALNIPYKFLTKIMTELVKFNFIKSIRGREGGYTLSRSPENITIMEIVKKFDDSIESKQCLLGIGLCDGSNRCGLHDQWIQPKNMIKNMFNNTTLANLNEENYKI